MAPHLSGASSPDSATVSQRILFPLVPSDEKKVNELESLTKEWNATVKPGINDFLWTTAPVTHVARRRAILKAHPEIEDLYGPDPKSGYFAVATAVVQLALGVCVSRCDPSFWRLLLITYVVSCTLNHSLYSAFHELSHNLISPVKWHNQWLAIFINIPVAVPAAISFRRYHLDHHIFMGVDWQDPDIPTNMEGWLFRKWYAKLLWVLVMPLTYGVRPLVRMSKGVTQLEVVNFVVCMTCNMLFYHFLGWKGLFYFLGGTLIGLGAHPISGHFIAEHMWFPGKGEPYQETFSYYGCLNFLTYDVGYHVEHHDFPSIPGSRLHLVRKIAPEFYDLPSHNSWCWVLWNFIFDDRVCPYNRIKRPSNKGGPVGSKHQHNLLHKLKWPPTPFCLWGEGVGQDDKDVNLCSLVKPE